MRHTLLIPLLIACTGGSPDDTGADSDPLTVTPRTCTGFADTPDVFSIESPLVSDYFMYSADGLGAYWSLADLTGDGLPDLVHHAHGNNADAEEMADAWYVWPGNGDGFDGMIAWTLPFDHRLIDGFHAANSIQTVIDINSDGFLDLVLAKDPETNAAFGGDKPYWSVYLSDGATGFSTTETQWTLPALQTPTEVYEGSSHTVRDIDGDGVVELIRTQEQGANFGTTDVPHWRIHAATDSGFSEEYTEWALPPARSVHGDYNNWSSSDTVVLDVTGDGVPELVLPRDVGWPYDIYGEEPDWHWRVHLNEGDGFSADHVEWSLPDPAFVFPSSSADIVYPTSTDWRTMSIGGGTPVLVVTHDFETGEPFIEDGQPIWAIFDATGEGFADTHSSWAVPDEVFASFWSGGGTTSGGWHTVDMDGDGCADLVLTGGLDLGSPEGDTWEWWVYRGE